MASSLPATREGIGFALRALRYRNYRLFFGGQIVSLCGTWIAITATRWLVYRLTGSALLLGVVAFASQMPALLLMPAAGIVADRWDRRRLLVGTQTMAMLTSLTLAGLTLTGRIAVPSLLAISVVQGIVTGLDLPARQAFVVTLVDDERDIANAVALNSFMFNAATFVGPSIAGAIIAASNEGWCFLVDGVSFVAVILALLAMRVPATDSGNHQLAAGEQFAEGWRYATGSTPIRSMIALSAIVGLLGVPYSVLLPIYAGSIVGGGPSTLGFLMTASGAGTLFGALWLATRRGAEGLQRTIPAAAMAFGAALIGFAVSRFLWTSVPLMFVAGFGAMVQFASSNTLLQTIVENDKRGRVLSFFLMAYFGTTPFGALVAGAASARYGAAATIVVSGACCIAGALWYQKGIAAIPDLRPAPVTAAKPA